MSSTNRGGERVERDRYYTPITAVNPLLNVLNLRHDHTFLEPCRGDGVIIDAVPCSRRLWAELDDGVDYLLIPFEQVDVIITNPPFLHALAFLIKSLREGRSVFYLLPVNFLGSKTRKPFWNTNPPTHQLVLSERPCFVWVCKNCKAKYRPGAYRLCTCIDEEGQPGRIGPQTDSIEYAWFGWDRLGICTLSHWMNSL